MQDSNEKCWQSGSEARQQCTAECVHATVRRICRRAQNGRLVRQHGHAILACAGERDESRPNHYWLPQTRATQSTSDSELPHGQYLVFTLFSVRVGRRGTCQWATRLLTEIQVVIASDQNADTDIRQTCIRGCTKW